MRSCHEHQVREHRFMAIPRRSSGRWIQAHQQDRCGRMWTSEVSEIVYGDRPSWAGSLRERETLEPLDVADRLFGAHRRTISLTARPMQSSWSRCLARRGASSMHATAGTRKALNCLNVPAFLTEVGLQGDSTSVGSRQQCLPWDRAQAKSTRLRHLQARVRCEHWNGCRKGSYC